MPRNIRGIIIMCMRERAEIGNKKKQASFVSYNKPYIWMCVARQEEISALTDKKKKMNDSKPVTDLEFSAFFLFLKLKFIVFGCALKT